MKPTVLRLKKDQERRLLAGHLWVYSNEVDTAATPLKALEPGQTVELVAANGRRLGLAYANPNSLICARLLSRRPNAQWDQEMISERLRQALALRESIYRAPFYRLVFGESDGLPGLVVDRYGKLLVIQITTAGMERMRDAVLNALDDLLRPDAMLLRNDTAMRQLEGLVSEVTCVRGELPEQVEIEENGLRFVVSPGQGQKTGWFYDQADNRVRMRRYVKGARVLDVCSYLGGWGVSAAAWGARYALCLDVSGHALEGVGQNAELNGCMDRVEGLKGDAFEGLKQLMEQGERFDLVVLDPPAFIKRKKDLDTGLEAYARLNRLGLSVLSPGGVLATSSCSFHLQREMLLRTVQKGARRNGRFLQLLEAGQQSADHPVHPAVPETAYLKTFFLRGLEEL
jgi:23S rRNA (cytosine1962-C5)-methyltransferase